MNKNENLTQSSLIDGLKLMTLSVKQLALDSNVDKLHTPHYLFTLIIFILQQYSPCMSVVKTYRRLKYINENTIDVETIKTEYHTVRDEQVIPWLRPFI